MRARGRELGSRFFGAFWLQLLLSLVGLTVPALTTLRASAEHDSTRIPF